ncbi:MAG: glycosyltransferase [Chryseobacterium sp.]|nr:glycosyltransferase [Chryseobacterium sp.]
MKLLSIIILTYHSNNDIINCIESLLKYSDIPEEKLEIIIVDNSPMEVFLEMEKMVQTIYGNRVIIIKNIENKGFGQGNNVGIRASKGKYICVSNPDILFMSPMFKNTVDMFENDKDLALIGGKQLGGRNVSFLNRMEYDFFVITAPLYALLNKLDIYTEKYSYLSGALLFMDKSKFEEIGLFDENIFLCCEEADITKRFLDKNYKTKFRKDFVYKHLVEGRGISTERGFYYNYEAAKIYLEKNNYSFNWFLTKKIISYRIIKFVYTLLGRKEDTEKNRLYLSRFQKMKKEFKAK